MQDFQERIDLGNDQAKRETAAQALSGTQGKQKMLRLDLLQTSCSPDAPLFSQVGTGEVFPIFFIPYVDVTHCFEGNFR